MLSKEAKLVYGFELYVRFAALIWGCIPSVMFEIRYAGVDRAAGS